MFGEVSNGTSLACARLDNDEISLARSSASSKHRGTSGVDSGVVGNKKSKASSRSKARGRGKKGPSEVGNVGKRFFSLQKQTFATIL